MKMGMMRKKRGILVLVAILAMSISIAGIGIVPVMGHNPNVEPIYSGAAYTPPAIDGVIGEGEWRGANILDYGDGVGNVTVWVMNDGDNLYVAATWNDLTPEGVDIIGFSFDTDHNGTLTEGQEDGVVVFCANDSGLGIDGHYSSTVWMNIGIDLLQNINAGATYTNGNWTVEWSKPLSSGDLQDMDVEAGDTMGIFGKIIDDFNGSIAGASTNEAILATESIGACSAVGAWPPGANGNDASTYGDIVLKAKDLKVSKIKPNCGYIFANESNNITVTIKNVGIINITEDFNVSIEVGGFSEEVRVSGGLDANTTTTITVTNSTSRNAGESVTINVTADCNGEVGESNEANNVMNITKTVVNNGYKGKRYTGGEDVKTWKTFELNGSVLYSLGDSYYESGYYGWPDGNYTANWTASDLPVPAGATVEEARLYVPYTFDYGDDIPTNVSLTFNGAAKTFEAHYTDRKGHASWNYPYGMLAYNVTDEFNSTDSNTAMLTNSNWDQKTVSMRGMVLIVIYADDSEPTRQIFVNEEFDLLYGGSSKCTTPEEATAYAPFAGAITDIANKSARLITVAPGADGPEGDLIFNGQIWTDVWSFTTNAQIGIDDRDVTEYLNETANEAGFQSSADYMEASNAILVVTAKVDTEAPVVTNATASPLVIPDDTDDDPTCFGTNCSELSMLNVTVNDESAIALITINLSQIGGSEAAEMTNISGTDIWTVITNASNSTAGWNGTAYVPYELRVNATDEYGNSNVSVCIELRVMKNGDVQPYDGDGTVDFMHDALYLVRNTLNVPGYADIRENIADVTGDCEVDFMHDALYLVRNTLNVPGYEILH
jgi:hypothetical protein